MSSIITHPHSGENILPKGKSFYRYRICLALSSILLCLLSESITAQGNSWVSWQKCLGGSAFDEAHAIQQTSDGGYVVAGYATSVDGDVIGSHGSGDQWIVKLDSLGTIQWQKPLGGSDDDWAHSMQQTNDNGYILAGYSRSVDGQVTGNHGLRDYWVVKLDEVGNLVWQKSLGGSARDNAHSIQQTNDGGFIVAGLTESIDGDVSENNGGKDFWIVKLDASGNIVWEKSLGGSSDDDANSIRETTDGGFIVAGFSFSNDGDVNGNYGNSDCWIVKLDASGNILWQRCLGGSADEGAYCIRQAMDGGYIVAGYSASADGNLTVNYGATDCWLIKLDGSGNITWQKVLGGSLEDVALTVEQISDGNFVMAGFTRSNDVDVSGNHGNNDAWIVSLDDAGNMNWQVCAGGTLGDSAFSIQEIAEGRFIVAGGSFSNDGDVLGNKGSNDFWIFELDPSIGIDEIRKETFFTVSPNPSGGEVKISSYLHAESTTIELLDITGKRLISISDNWAYNIQSYNLNLGTLSNGTYLVKMILVLSNPSGKQSGIRKLILHR